MMKDGDTTGDAVDSIRGVDTIETAERWLRARRIEDIECVLPDQSGVARGKMMPTRKFLNSPDFRMPGTIFWQTITGAYPDEYIEEAVFDPADGDLVFTPDLSTLTVVPWEADPTAQVLLDARRKDGTSVDLAPRQLLRRILALYEKMGWRPVVAPELEFYLVKPNTDPDYPLEPPIGRSGRPEIGRQGYSIAAINEFDDVVDDIYDFSEAQGLEIDTLSHEDGAAQMEINLAHGDPLELADQVFSFKRTIREAALKHNIYATFMAKPMSDEPGSAMHIHQSIIDHASGRNIFSDDHGAETAAFHAFIAGHQKYLPHVMCMLAPYVNSYRRLTRWSAAPINVRWGYDNRTVGLRVPDAKPAARRVENRVPSSDANPYYAIAASLACGYLGMIEGLKPDEPISGSARMLDFGLPRSLLDAVELFKQCEPLYGLFGEEFMTVYRDIKYAEFEMFMRVISAWEREYLLLNV
ncbi:MAG: glutamine synthetase family protein [Pseudomonadota bacterium]